MKARKMYVEPLTPTEHQALVWAVDRGHADLVETGEIHGHELSALERAMTKIRMAQAKVGKA